MIIQILVRVIIISLLALTMVTFALSGFAQQLTKITPLSYKVESDTIVKPPPVNRKDFTKKALDKTKKLGTYITLICGKKTTFIEAHKSIKKACELFVNNGEDVIIEVSSVNRKTISRDKAPEYLGHLINLEYDKVEISWSDITYVSDLKQGGDKRWYGTVTISQRFKGFIEDKLVYSDWAKKNITVILETYQKSGSGDTSIQWDVLLGDIGVIETNK